MPNNELPHQPTPPSRHTLHQPIAMYNPHPGRRRLCGNIMCTAAATAGAQQLPLKVSSNDPRVDSIPEKLGGNEIQGTATHQSPLLPSQKITQITPLHTRIMRIRIQFRQWRLRLRPYPVDGGQRYKGAAYTQPDQHHTDAVRRYIILMGRFEEYFCRWGLS